MDWADLATLGGAIVGALIAAVATVYAAGRASSRRQDRERITRLILLRKSTAKIVSGSIKGFAMFGATEGSQFNHLVTWVLGADDYEPLSQAAIAFHAAAVELGRLRRHGMPDEEGAEEAVNKLIDAGITIERVTRAMAATYGKRLLKPATPWGSPARTASRG